ncbi:phage integrase SAM-like domain-containing protein [Ulvibacter antarcticus]|uniref:Integrase n=1 Tax=Ulvibacter antarcticus TaxID=442714 RepID=A0A3L9Y7F5_9FLAO|nr:phage integrase SAM-like domain-containing protein [Ulvibacter antarcticus]RMA56641.1 integrase [Ulvibacter antarcticus]
MATIKFQLQSKSNNAPIYLRLSLGRNKSIKRKTGLSINPKEWSTVTGLPKQNNPSTKNLTPKLKKLSAKIYDKLNDALSNGKSINGEWLNEQIDIHFERINENKQSELVTDAIQSILNMAEVRKNSLGGIGLSKSRINSYKGLLRIFQEYQKGNSHKVKEVNVKFANDFLKYLLHEKKYSKTYAVKKIADLKTVCSNAGDEGIKTHPKLKKIPSANSKNEAVIYLTPSELDRIAVSDKVKGDALLNARKWLLLGCNIGQRGGDLLNINENNFVTRNGYEVIELTQQKTGKNITIPVLDTTKEILKTGLPYKISIQKLNEYIKLVCELSEINELTKGGIIEVTENGNGNKQKRKNYGKYPKHKLITSHVCRRSFATNTYGVLPTPLIMQITAHSTEKMFLNYIGKDRLDYAQQIADFYTLQAQKAKKEPQLSVVKNSVNQ